MSKAHPPELKKYAFDLFKSINSLNSVYLILRFMDKKCTCKYISQNPSKT